MKLTIEVPDFWRTLPKDLLFQCESILEAHAAALLMPQTPECRLEWLPNAGRWAQVWR